VTRSQTRAIVATALGNMLEWYDFTVYALFAPAIAANFFPPSDDAATPLVKAFLVFGLGFVARPLGAVLLGNYGDRAGRKAALLLTVALMALGTGIIACAPTYASIGAGAPVLLLAGRVLQGFSAGGEVGAATVYLLESAPAPKRGRVASWLQASMGLSNIAGALTAFLVAALLAPDQVRAWGWRIPFLIGLSIAPAGLLLRRALSETDAFAAMAAARLQAAATVERGGGYAPLLTLVRDHGRRLWIGFCVAVLWAVAVYVLMIFLPTYVQRPDTFGFTARQAFGASLIGNCPFVAGCVFFGALSDRIGRRRSLSWSAASMLVCVLPMLLWLHAQPTPVTLIIVQSILCVLVSSFVGVAPAALAEIFPAAVRATGTSLVYNGAFMVFGGFAPFILTWVTEKSGGSVYAPAWYVMFAAAVALFAIPFLGRRDPTPARNALRVE
jgi:MHS family proline/betaine transporter-like MFS transporter